MYHEASVSSVTTKPSVGPKKQPVTVKQAPKKSAAPPVAKKVQGPPKEKPNQQQRA
jgi:hypothetical protein